MFSDIIKLLNERGTMSVQEISLALETESSALHPMLEMLAQKGKVLQVDLPCKSGCSGGCTKADTMIYYKPVKDD